MSDLSASVLKKQIFGRIEGEKEEEVQYIKAYRHTNHDSVASGNESIQREPVYDTMPRSQWVRINATENAANRLSQRLTSALKSGEYSVDDSTLSQLKVSMTNQVSGSRLALVVKSIKHVDSKGDTLSTGPDIGAVMDATPTSVSGQVVYNGKTERRNGIPVEVKEARHKNQSYFDQPYRPVPGGCETDGCTLGTPAQDSSGDSVWITAAHCTNSDDEKRIDNVPFKQPGGGNEIGKSEDVPELGDGDVAKIRPSGANVTWDIAAPKDDTLNYEYPVEGIVTDETIKIKLDDSEYTTFQGAASGRVDNASVKSYTPDSKSGNQVEIAANSQGGDSGCPYFDVIAGGAYILAIHRAEGDIPTYAKGTTMEWTENKLDITV